LPCGQRRNSPSPPASRFISPTHTRTEGRSPVLGTEFSKKVKSRYTTVGFSRIFAQAKWKIM
jgi:hypothetical protein